MKSQELRILIITCFGHFMCHFNMMVFPALVLPLGEQLNLDMAQVLGLSFWMYLFFGLTALPWGMVADRRGGKPLIGLFFLGAGLSGLSAAMYIDSPLRFSIALAGVGFFSGIYHPTGLGLISKGVSRMSLAMGYNGMFGSLGLAIAPLLTGILNWLWGPSGAYLVLGGLNLLGIGLIIFFPLPESRHEQETGSEGKNGLLGAFLILPVAMMLAGIAYRGATVILPAYFELKNQWILQALSGLWAGDLSRNLVATTVTSLIYMIGILGQYTGGRVAERLEPRFSYLAFHALIVPAAFFISIARDLPLVALALFYFFFMFGAQPIENTLVARLTPSQFHHSAYGVKFVLTFGVGALAVKLVGGIQTTWGTEAIFQSLGMISMALVAAILLLIIRTKPMKPDHQVPSANL